jgi:SNF family Na+-dependent transporter
MDFWAGTFLLVLLGTFEAVIFSWIFGVDRGFEELREGAHIAIPGPFRFIMKYVTPVYLIVILVAWFVTDGWQVILLRNIDPAERVTFCAVTLGKSTFITLLRSILLLVWGGFLFLIFWAWKTNKLDERLDDASSGKGGNHA